MATHGDTSREKLELILGETKLPLAKEILDAGFRLLPVLGTIPQVDELPLGSVIQDSKGSVYRRAEGIYYDGPHDWQSFDGDFWDVTDFAFPVTVIASGAYSKD